MIGLNLDPGPWSDWLYRALVLLVIGRPSALVISSPVSIVAALAAALESRTEHLSPSPSGSTLPRRESPLERPRTSRSSRERERGRVFDREYWIGSHPILKERDRGENKSMGW